jgi:hypothetical protein
MTRAGVLVSNIEDISEVHYTLGSMSHLRHDAMIVTCAIAFAWFATPWARIGWLAIAIPESYSTTVAWLDYGLLSEWVFEFLWGAAIAVLLTRALRSRGAFWWSLLIGVQLGASHFAFSHWHFAPDARSSVYVWAYGQYLMPVMGAVAASWLVAKYWPRERLGKPNAA